MAAAKKNSKAARSQARDWKLVLADLRRTEREVAELKDGIADFRETLDLAKKRLAFIRSCVEKRVKDDTRKG
jgi:hypothetical protein